MNQRNLSDAHKFWSRNFAGICTALIFTAEAQSFGAEKRREKLCASLRDLCVSAVK